MIWHAATVIGGFVFGWGVASAIGGETHASKRIAIGLIVFVVGIVLPI